MHEFRRRKELVDGLLRRLVGAITEVTCHSSSASAIPWQPGLVSVSANIGATATANERESMVCALRTDVKAHVPHLDRAAVCDDISPGRHGALALVALNVPLPRVAVLDTSQRYLPPEDGAWRKCPGPAHRVNILVVTVLSL